MQSVNSLCDLQTLPSYTSSVCRNGEKLQHLILRCMLDVTLKLDIKREARCAESKTRNWRRPAIQERLANMHIMFTLLWYSMTYLWWRWTFLLNLLLPAEATAAPHAEPWFSSQIIALTRWLFTCFLVRLDIWDVHRSRAATSLHKSGQTAPLNFIWTFINRDKQSLLDEE